MYVLMFFKDLDLLLKLIVICYLRYEEFCLLYDYLFSMFYFILLNDFIGVIIFLGKYYELVFLVI